MPPIADGSKPYAVGFVPTLLANLFPIIGVLMFGWDSETLIVLYVLELFFSILFAAAKALFAQRAPQTRDDTDNTLISISSDLEHQDPGTVAASISAEYPIYHRSGGLWNTVIACIRSPSLQNCRYHGSNLRA